jgi:hypothetical protein
MPPVTSFEPFDNIIINNSAATNHTNSDDFTSLGSGIPQKIKEKIWAGDIIVMSILLKSTSQLHDYADDGPFGELQIKNGKLCITKLRGSTFKSSVEQWSSAFIVFISIFIEPFPNRSQELLKYLRDIRLAATRSDSWWKYDEQFRHNKSNNRSSSWGTINLELWLLHVNGHVTRAQEFIGQTRPAIRQPTTQVSGPPTSKLFKQRMVSPKAGLLTCNYFNSGRNCPFNPCRYSHVCRLCGGTLTGCRRAKTHKFFPVPGETTDCLITLASQWPRFTTWCQSRKLNTLKWTGVSGLPRLHLTPEQTRVPDVALPWASPPYIEVEGCQRYPGVHPTKRLIQKTNTMNLHAFKQVRPGERARQYP